MSSRKTRRPGITLVEKFLKPNFLTPQQLANHIRVPHVKILRVIDGLEKIDQDLAIKLAGAFNTEPDFWMILQARYDVERALEKTTAPKSILSPFETMTTDPAIR